MEGKLQREVIETGDGSKTIHFPELNEQYHSKHGAIKEAKHVFIKHGFDFIRGSMEFRKLDILEIGFGTGLNAFITYLESQKINLQIEYVGVEAYPVDMKEIQQLNYVEVLSSKPEEGSFQKMHETPWEKSFFISPTFSLTKRKQFFSDIEDKNTFDLIYFDAFGARVQPELWTVKIFQKMYDSLKEYGVLVTYSAKGSVRRALQEVGFTVERLPGPPGKREMLRAVKIL